MLPTVIFRTTYSIKLHIFIDMELSNVFENIHILAYIGAFYLCYNVIEKLLQPRPTDLEPPGCRRQRVNIGQHLQKQTRETQ